MNRLNRKGILGFTIIELMIVLVVVAIPLELTQDGVKTPAACCE